jgi:thiol-disulfide isomerase/thioredoxin
MVQEYSDNAYVLFEVYGIGENGTAEDLKNGIKENYMKYGAPEDEVDAYLNGLDIIEAGSAEDYNFYLCRGIRRSETFKESQADYKEEYDALYDAFDTYAANFTFMRPLALAELIAEGTGFSFETKDLDGNTVSSAELFGGKKVTMVNIWETTCSACMSEMPELNKLAEEFKAKGGQIVGLVYDALDEELIAEAKDIAGDLELTFVNLLPTQEMDDFFKVQAFPTTYFFNDKGEVIGEPVMGAAPDLYVTRMLELLGE